MLPILVEPCDGGFRASLLGSADLRVCGPSKGEAIEALQAIVRSRLAADRAAAKRGDAELLWAEGLYAGSDPTWPPRDYDPIAAEITREMVAEIYRERDEQKAREFPE
jgi:hypothetical protein